MSSATPPPPTILDVGYRSTHYWVVSAGTSRVLVDIGWPGTLGMMKANLRRMGVPLREIRYALATHHHIDHAGLAEELKREGVPLLVIDVQAHAIPAMKRWTKPEDRFVDITPDGNVTIACRQSRALLADIGIAGAIVHTPGHSDDSVSLVLDGGAAFTGDLPRPEQAGDDPVTAQSWRRLREHGAQRVYPAHGPVWSIEPNGV